MGQVLLLDSFEREEKFNESRERARSENGKHEDDKHSRRHITKRTIEGQKKEKKGTPFRAFSRASSFLSAFRPQDALVFHRKQRGRSKTQEIDRSKKRRAQKKAKSVSILVRI